MDSADLTTIDDTLHGLGAAAQPAAIEALVRRHLGSTRITAKAADALLAELTVPGSAGVIAVAPLEAKSGLSDAVALEGDDEGDDGLDVTVDTDGEYDDSDEDGDSIDVELDEV